MLRFGFIFLCLFTFPAVAQDIKGVPTIIDGDTIDIRGTRIRLFGLDAPEKSQTCKIGDKIWACGHAATNALSEMVGAEETQCWKTDTDRYGRMVAVCLSGDKYLNAKMVSMGHAVAYVKYSKAFVPLEAIARQEQRGLWRSEFELPWDWRISRRNAAKQNKYKSAKKPKAAAGNCSIKGNISRSGRIYHVPGGAYYGRTKIDESKGERWFCSAVEAENAGWRRSSK